MARCKAPQVSWSHIEPHAGSRILLMAGPVLRSLTAVLSFARDDLQSPKLELRMFSDAAYSFVSLLDEETALVPTAKERESERLCFRALAAATIHPSEQVCYVFARDLPLGGISFLHPVALKEGQCVDLLFADGRSCSVQVRWVRKVDSHCFMMGCQFTKNAFR
jgi:hypothetical protein